MLNTDGLFHLQLSKGVGVVSKAQGIEGAAGVGGGIRALAEGAAVGAVHLSTAHEDDLRNMTQSIGTWDESGGLHAILQLNSHFDFEGRARGQTQTWHARVAMMDCAWTSDGLPR